MSEPLESIPLPAAAPPSVPAGKPLDEAFLQRLLWPSEEALATSVENADGLERPATKLLVL